MEQVPRGAIEAILTDELDLRAEVVKRGRLLTTDSQFKHLRACSTHTCRCDGESAAVSARPAAALGVPNQIYGEEVVRYAVAKPGGSLTEASVRQHCEAMLSPPKMPKQIFIVCQLAKKRSRRDLA